MQYCKIDLNHFLNLKFPSRICQKKALILDPDFFWEQRGQFNLAKKFYSSSKKAFKCGGFINTCEGLDIPYEVSRALNRIKTSKQALAPPGEAPTGAQTIPSKLDKKKLIVDKSLTAKAGKGISSKSIDDNTILLKNYYGNINKFKSHASKTVL